jgi:glycerol-3-phosphate cytidylyltransferase
MIRVVTYGTFDLFHIGHLRLLERARLLGDELYVGVSTDEFNKKKGKNSIYPFEHRVEIISGLRCVTQTFPEDNWEQKIDDFASLKANIFVMGDDWLGKFDEFETSVSVHYLPRTQNVSTSDILAIIRASGSI